jgi:hypothetical protein
MPKIALRQNNSLAIDGDRFLKDLRLPYCTISSLRQMRVGDVFELMDFYGPPMFTDGEPLSASASIERVRGGLRFSGLWMLHVGKTKLRGHMWCSGFEMVLRPSRKFEMVKETDIGHLKLFVRIIRLATRLADMAKKAGDRDAAYKMRPLITTSAERLGFYIPFLDKIADKPRR